MTDEKIYEELKQINRELSAVHTKVDTIAEVKEDIDKLQDCNAKMKGDIRELKVKAGVWGTIGGAIPASVAVLIALFKN